MIEIEWTPVKDIMGNIRTLVDNNLDENWQSKSSIGGLANDLAL